MERKLKKNCYYSNWRGLPLRARWKTCWCFRAQWCNMSFRRNVCKYFQIWKLPYTYTLITYSMLCIYNLKYLYLYFPNSGRYSHAHILDYPSVSHINYIAQTNSYVVIFMVTQEYKVLKWKKWNGSSFW